MTTTDDLGWEWEEEVTLPPGVHPPGVLVRDPTEEDKKADRLAGVLLVYVTGHPGASTEEVTDPHRVYLGSPSWALAARTRAVDAGLLTETRCGPQCRACARQGVRPSPIRRHYWTGEPGDFGDDDY